MLYNEITGGGMGAIIAGYNNVIENNPRYAIVFGSRESRINQATISSGPRQNVIIGGYQTTNTAGNAYSFGPYINNDHAGTMIFRTHDGSSTRFQSASTNTFLIKTGGVGINTNNPQADLHVNGMVQIDSVKVYASGTNLYLTDGSSFTNLITTTPL
jgi:hypothetical protein